MQARAPSHPRPVALGVRVLIAVLGGYAFCWGLIALSVTTTFALGGSFADGEWLGWILMLLVFPVVFLGAFAVRSAWLVAVVLFGGGALMTGAASLIQASLT